MLTCDLLSSSRAGCVVGRIRSFDQLQSSYEITFIFCFFSISLNNEVSFSLKKNKTKNRLTESLPAVSLCRCIFISPHFISETEWTECVNQPTHTHRHTHTHFISTQFTLKDKTNPTEAVKPVRASVHTRLISVRLSDKFKNIKNFVLQLQIHVSFYRMHIFIFMWL